MCVGWGGGGGGGKKNIIKVLSAAILLGSLRVKAPKQQTIKIQQTIKDSADDKKLFIIKKNSKTRQTG